MIKICEEFGIEYDILFNPVKTICIIFGYKGCLNRIPKMKINGKLIPWSKQAKHLGNVVSYDLKDVHEIHAKKCDLIGRVNSLIANFKCTSRTTCSKLFNAQCCHLYGSQAWSLEQRSLEPFVVSWRKAVRKIWYLPHNARSALLPDLIGSRDLESMVYERVANLYTGMFKGHNPKMYHLISTSIDSKPMGLIGNNVMRISKKWNCGYHSLKNNHSVVQNDDIKARVAAIKELSQCRLHDADSWHISGFNHDEICQMIEHIATYR